ncbi:MAG: hypothetical protein Q4F67_16165 [Propionibacteriaceae bacterium]|nr:hypothetical protein [Propionibacteriaceae bacterium]
MLSATDLRRCRRVLGALPEGHRAHGFSCARAELAAWPRSEIFAFAQDVRPYYGELEPLLPEVERRDVEEGARLAVAGVYHAAAHTLLSEADLGGHRQGLQKLLFFTISRPPTYAAAPSLLHVPSCSACWITMSHGC